MHKNLTAASIRLVFAWLCLAVMMTEIQAEPVTGHPRLLFRAEHLPELRNRAVWSNEVYAAFKAGVVDKAFEDWKRSRDANGNLLDANGNIIPANQSYGLNAAPEDDTGQYTGNGNPVTSEIYAMLFAFMSLIETNEPLRGQYVAAAKECLFKVIDQAVLGVPEQPDANGQYPPFRHPNFALADRSFAGEAFPLAVDWLYPELTAAEKAKLRKVFIDWAQRSHNHYYYAPRNPNYLAFDPAIFNLNDPTDPNASIRRQWIRTGLNNHYANHMRFVGLAALSFDPADDLPNATVGDIAAAGTLTSYTVGSNSNDCVYTDSGFLRDAIGSWLYVTDHAFQQDGAGGLSQEGMQYASNGLGPAALFMLALHTAGQDDPSVWGRLVSLENHHFWDNAVSGYLALLPPVPRARKNGVEWLGQVFEPAHYGDQEKYFLNDQFIKLLAPLAIRDQYVHGTTAPRTQAARYIQRHLTLGGTTKLATRISSCYSESRFRDAIYYFLLFDPNAPAPTDPRLTQPKTWYASFDPAGKNAHLLSRTGLGPDAVYFDWRLGWSRIDHQKADGLSFELWKNGVWLTKRWAAYGPVSGCGDFNNTLTMQANPLPPNGNTYGSIYANHGSGWVYGASGDGHMIAHSLREGFLYLEGDATEHYNHLTNPDQQTAEHVSRALVWLKPNHVIIYDRLKSQLVGYKRWWLNLPEAPVINGNQAQATAYDDWTETQWANGASVTTLHKEAKAKLFISSLLPVGATLTADLGRPNDFGYDETADGENMTARLKVEAPGSPMETRFLHVLQAAEAGGNIAADATSLIQSIGGTPFVGAIIADRAVLFPTEAAAIVTNVIYAVPNVVSTHYITGLAPNSSYQIAVVSENGLQQVSVTPGASSFFTDSGGILVIGGNETPGVSISALPQNISETGPATALTVHRSGDTSSPLVVNYTVAGTAQNGSDFSSLPGSVTIPANSASVIIILSPINDATSEGQEFVTIAIDPMPSYHVDESAGSGSVTILDDDPPAGGLFQFAAPSLSFSEGAGLVSIPVQRIGGSSGQVKVRYTLTSGSATAGSDFTASAGGWLTWPSGATGEQSIEIQLLDDSIWEGNETFTVALTQIQGLGGLGSSATAQVTVVENDLAPVGQFQLGAATYSAGENAGTLNIPVFRVNGSSGAVSVSYTVSNGSAVAGQDFSVPAGTPLIWASGDTSPKTITVTIIDDSSYEGTAESFTLSLTNPTGGANLGSPSTALVTIADNDPLPSEYDVGDGKPYPTLSSVPWQNLGPGSIVRIHWRATPYHEKILLSSRGTLAQPIKIIGMPGANGERPIIDGQNATTSSSLKFLPWSSMANYGLIVIARDADEASTFKPGYIEVDGLEVRNATAGAPFTDGSGSVQSYSSSGGAFYIKGAEHVTIRNCVIHHAAQGIVAQSGSTEPDVTRDLLIEKNFIHSHGASGAYHGNNILTEGVGVTLQYNRLGAPLSGSNVANLKDRSAGTVIRYNWIEGGGYSVDLVEPVGASAIIKSDGAFQMSYVYGNILRNSQPDGSTLVHYGGDYGNTPNYRAGTLHFYHNTVAISSSRWSTYLFSLSVASAAIEARNNIFHVQGGTQLLMLGSSGTVHLGVNWLSSGWQAGWSGTVNGSSNSITGVNPGFADLATGDLHLLANATARNIGGPLAVGVPTAHTVTSQYVLHQSAEARPSDPAGADLGAFEFVVPASVLTLAASEITANSAKLNGAINPNNQAAQAYFEWGPNTNYGNASAPVDIPSGSQLIGINTLLTGLASKQTYHYRAVAMTGGVSIPGLDQLFSTLNNSPVALPDMALTQVNTAVAIPVGSLLGNDSDPEGDSLTITGVSAATSQAGTALLSNGLVIYQPAANFTGQDSFTYTVTDGFGGDATATVAITVQPMAPPMPSVTNISVAPNGARVVTFAGTVGTAYTIQGSSDLAVWITLGTATAGSDGAFQLQDGNVAGVRFYRVKLP